MAMKEITDKEYEMYQKLLKIWKYSAAEKTGLFFVCGEAGEKDQMGLPEKIMVCPTMGLDGFAIYTKTSDYSAPGW